MGGEQGSRTGSLKAFGGWFVATFVIGAFGFGQRITEPPTLAGAALVAGVLAWFMAYKVMPTSKEPKPVVIARSGATATSSS